MKCAPLKHNPIRQIASRHLAVISLAVAGVVGCDERADSNKAVLEKIDSGLGKLAGVSALQPGDNLNAAKADLTSAAGQSGADPSYTAVASAGIALLDQEAATAGIAKLNALQFEVRTTLAHLRALGQQVMLANQFAVGYSQSDPKVAVGQLAGHISAMQGNAQSQTWGPSDSVHLPSLASVKQESSRIAGDIAQRQQQLADLNKQRTDALAAAETQGQHADSLKGVDAVKTFAEASESRRKADDLAINIDLVQSQLDRLQADLSLQQGQEKSLTAGIAALQTQGKQIETAWSDLQKHAQAQTAIANGVVSGDEKTTDFIKDFSQKLAAQLNAVKEQRTAILDQYGEAEKYFTAAKENAEKYIQSIQPNLTGTGKGVAHYRALRETLHPMRYELQLGTVKRDAGAVITSEASLLADVESTRASVQSNLEAAKLQLPSELSGIDTASMKALMEEAETRLSGSVESLTNVESGDAPEALKKSAKVARLIAMHDHLSLYDLKQSGGDSSAKQQADQMKTDAMQLKNDIVTAGLMLPGLPGDLGVPPPPLVPEPVATPTTMPTPEASPTPGAAAPTPDPRPAVPMAVPSAAPAPAPTVPAPAAPAPSETPAPPQGTPGEPERALTPN